MSEELRRCNDCRAELPLDAFSKQTRGRGGLNSHCRDCAAERWQRYSERKRAERATMPRPPPPAGNWVDVSHIHAVSDDGRVWSYKYKRLLSGVMSRDGYRKIPMGGKVVFVHRLVAEAFVPGGGEQVRHKDGDKLNNAASNLEWGSCRDNILDKWKHGKMVIGERHHCHKVPLSEVAKIRASDKSNSELGRIYGVSRSAIYNIRKGVSYGWMESDNGR